MNTHDDQFGNDSGGDDIHAGEHVLGVLTAGERQQARGRIAAEPLFAQLVETWEERLAALLPRIEPATPPSHVWPRIRTRLGWSPVVAARPGLWNNAAFWRIATGLAAAAGIAAVVIGVRFVQPVVTPPVVVQTPTGEEQAARPVTVLHHDDGTTGWLASIDAAHGKVLMVPVPAPADASGLVHELWLIPPGQAPQSLGFVSSEKAHTIVVPAVLRDALAVGATLAITLEPQAGIPHAAPTGPIVAKGGIKQI